MSHDSVTIPLTHLIASAATVAPSQRATFLATLLVGKEALIELLGDAGEDYGEGEPWSYPLTVQQARELKTKIDAKTWEVLREAVSNVEDGIGVAQWPRVKEITGVESWPQFSKGRLGGLNRALRKIDDIPANAVLIWEGDAWAENGTGDFKSGTLCIDGPAVRTLRTAMGLGETI